MKVTRNTQNQLIIEDRPWFIGLVLVSATLITVGLGLGMLMNGDTSGLLFVGGAAMPLFFIFSFVRRVQVVFHRPEGWVEIRRQNLRTRSTVRHKLSEISSASVETSRSSDSTTHRVVLHIPAGQSAGDHPLTKHYVSGGSSKRAASAINDWLN